MTDTAQAAADAAANNLATFDAAQADAARIQAASELLADQADSAASGDAAAASADSQATVSQAAVSSAVAGDPATAQVFDMAAPTNLYQVMLKQLLCFAEANGLRVVDIYDEACEHVRITVAAL